MAAAPQHLTGSIVAVIFGANMGVSFLAPIMAGLIADRFGLPMAVTAIAIFPLLASVISLMLMSPSPKRSN
jgi:MFS family permease